jgi:hypothetical protein
MTSSVLTTNELTTIDTFASQYNRWPTSYREWCPIITVPAIPYSKFYSIVDSARPGFSKDGTGTSKLAVAKQEHTANLVWIKYNIEIPYTDMIAARANNTPLLEQTLAEGLNKIDLEIERIIFQGLANEDGAIAISGLMDSGQNVTSADKWSTAPAPIEHMADGVLALNSYGYKEPFDVICSLSLKPDMQKLHNAASDMGHNKIVGANYDISNIYYAKHGASTDLKCYPLPAATSHDGVWVMVQGNNPQNFRLAEAFRPWIRMDSAVNTKDNMFFGRIDWMGTIQQPRVEATCHHLDVDFA